MHKSVLPSVQKNSTPKTMKDLGIEAMEGGG